MKNRKWLVWLLMALLAAYLGWMLYSSHFDWHGFWSALRQANPKHLLLGIAIIYTNYLIRAVRWSILLNPVKRVSPWRLIGSQFIGYTGLAIFGRLGELIRPYLIARRTSLTFSSQIAVVTVERIFDLGAFAILFSLNLALSPSLSTLPYHENFRLMGLAAAGLTAVIIAFAFVVRVSGAVVAAGVQRFIGLISKPAGESAAEKILSFRDGLNTLATFADFAWVSVLSLLLWLSIALAYVQVMRAFGEPVHSLSLSHILLLMGFSIVGSVVQLPGVGGGSQVATGLAMAKLFSVPAALASSAAIVLWLVTFMSVIPAGLIFAHFEKVSLRKAAEASESEDPELAAAAPEPSSPPL